MFVPLVRGVVEKTNEYVHADQSSCGRRTSTRSRRIEKEIRRAGHELVDATARIYASHFTEAEIEANAGASTNRRSARKVLVEEPKALDESMAYAAQLGDNLSEEVMRSMRAEMKKRGHDM